MLPEASIRTDKAVILLSVVPTGILSKESLKTADLAHHSLYPDRVGLACTHFVSCTCTDVGTSSFASHQAFNLNNFSVFYFNFKARMWVYVLDAQSEVPWREDTK